MTLAWVTTQLQQYTQYIQVEQPIGRKWYVYEEGKS